MAPALIIAGASVMAFGQYKQGQAAEAEGRSAKNVMEYNAQVEEREAAAKRAKAGFEQKRQAKAGARVKSALTAKLAAAGGSGSPVAADLSAEQAAELDLENLLIGYEGEVEARRHESQAALDRMQGKIYKQKGKNIKRAKMWEAGGSLLTGFGKSGAFDDWDSE